MNILFPLRFSLMRVGGAGIFNQLLIRYLSNNFKVFDLSLQEKATYANLENTGYAYRIKRHILTTYDILNFHNTIKKGKISLVHLSPSLVRWAVNRDIIYARKCVKSGIPFVTFFHGWNKTYQEYIERKDKIDTFRSTFDKSSKVFVLANEFKEKLIEWGFDKHKIILETTMLDNGLLEEFDIHNKLKLNKEKIRILFLSRVVKEKGVYETIDAYSILKSKGASVNLTIAGGGSELAAVKTYAKCKSIEDIEFPGFVMGKEKVAKFTDADIYIFPSYGEGMPITVLEAMAFGMPVITRKVGGLNDFFEHNKMGYYTDSLKPEVFAEFLEQLLFNRQLLKKMSIYNYNYAQNRFLASQVVKRIENVYEQVLSKMYI